MTMQEPKAGKARDKNRSAAAERSAGGKVSLQVVTQYLRIKHPQMSTRGNIITTNALDEIVFSKSGQNRGKTQHRERWTEEGHFMGHDFPGPAYVWHQPQNAGCYRSPPKSDVL